MCRTLYLICLVMLLSLPTMSQSAATGFAAAQSNAPSDCVLTQPIKDEPPKDPNADRFGFRFWHVNADRTIWVQSQDWVARSGHKVIWIRPQGTQLEVTGRRLDSKASPLEICIPCCYTTGFQVTGMRFPAAGCWEITAKAGNSELRFIIKVAPARRNTARRNAAR